MSKITDRVDGTPAREHQAFEGLVFSLQAERQQALEKRLAAKEKLSDFAQDAKLLFARQGVKNGRHGYYRGHDIWLVGLTAKASLRALRLLEEYALADMPADSWRAHVDAAVRVAEGIAKDDTLEDFERLEPWLEQIDALARDMSSVSQPTSQGPHSSEVSAAIDGDLQAAVWAPATLDAYAVVTSGTPAAIGASVHIVWTLSALIDRGDSPEIGCMMANVLGAV